MNKFRVILLGLGTVGSAVLRLLEKSDSIEVVAIMSRNASTLQSKLLFESWHDLQKALEQQLLAQPDAVIELLGGTDCLQIYRYFLGLQIPMITANKALLAEHGAQLFPLAQKNGCFIAAEASCGGGIPILQTLLYSSYQIHEFHGVLNGTCNYILSKMGKQNYSEVLAEAQAAGLAEADPFLDVSGTDSAHKLAILAMMSFGSSLRLEDILLQGIEGLCSEQIQAGEQLGLALKLLAPAQWHEGHLAMRVGPCFVAKEPKLSASPLAELSSSFNGISFYGYNVGHIYLQGRGAGASATASAVLSDLHQAASGIYAKVFADFANWPSPERFQKKNIWAKIKRIWLVFAQLPGTEELLSLGDTKISLLRDTAQDLLPTEIQCIPLLELPAERLLPDSK